MSRIADSMYQLCITLWVGGMLTVGFMVAPVLFQTIADRTLAGTIAGELFSRMAWIGLACGVYLLGYLMRPKDTRCASNKLRWVVLLMLALVVAGKFGVQPVLAQLKQDALPQQVMESALRDRFVLWHGVSSGLFLVQAILGILLVYWQDRGTTAR